MNAHTQTFACMQTCVCRHVHTHTHTHTHTQKQQIHTHRHNMMEKDQPGQNECHQKSWKSCHKENQHAARGWSTVGSLKCFLTCFWISITYSSLCAIKKQEVCETQPFFKKYKFSQCTWKQTLSIKARRLYCSNRHCVLTGIVYHWCFGKIHSGVNKIHIKK